VEAARAGVRRAVDGADAGEVDVGHWSGVRW
jgi:hypothetical protein